MIIRDGIVLLEKDDIVSLTGVTDRMLRRLVTNKRIDVVQAGGGGHPALYRWDSMPSDVQDEVRHHLKGDPEVLARAQVIEKHLVTVQEDMAFLDQFVAANGRTFTNASRRKHVLAVRIVALLAEADAVMNEGGPRAVVATYGLPAMELKAAICDYVKANKTKLPGKFPASFTRLEARKRAYLEAKDNGMPGASALVHGNQGNSNPSKVATEEQQSVLRLLAARPQNYATRAIASDYNTIARMREWPTITAMTVNRFLADGNNGRTVTLYSKGMAAYNDKYGIIIHRSRPSQPTYLWVHDGTPYELLYQKEVHGKMTYHHRKVVVVVVDPHSWYPVGYAIGDQDTVELSQQAMADAVRHMRDLCGSYALPWQVQSDRLGHKTLGEWYKGMGVIHTPAAPRNARSKIIEPWFAQHNDHYVNRWLNWSGHNITSSKKRQPNPDHLNAVKRAFPDEAGVIAQIHETIARERADKVQAFREAIADMPEGELRVIDRTRFLELFGTAHEWTNELTNGGIQPTLMGQQLTYQLPERELQQHVGTIFQVTYDPVDLSDVLVTAHEGGLRYLVPAARTVPMALRDHDEESRARLDGLRAMKLDMSQEAINGILGDNARVRELAELLIQDASLRMQAASKGIDTDVTTVPAAVEAVMRAYLTDETGHKSALRTARNESEPPALPPMDDSIERRAFDQI